MTGLFLRRFSQRIQRQQAGAGGAVMPGAESERRLDLDRDPIDRDACARMRAVNDKTAGFDGRQPVQARLHPIGSRKLFENQFFCGFLARLRGR